MNYNNEGEITRVKETTAKLRSHEQKSESEQMRGKARFTP
jgi:hypothetical protein